MSYDIYLFRPDPDESDAEQACWDFYQQNVKHQARDGWGVETNEIIAELRLLEPGIQVSGLHNGVELDDLDRAIQIHLWEDGQASASIPYSSEFDARLKKLRLYLDVFESHGFRVLDPQLGMVIEPGADLSELEPETYQGEDDPKIVELELTCYHEPNRLFQAYPGILKQYGWSIAEQTHEELRGTMKVPTGAGTLVYGIKLRKPFACEGTTKVSIAVYVEEDDGSGAYSCNGLCLYIVNAVVAAKLP